MTNLKRGIMNLQKVRKLSILKTVLISIFVIFSLISTGCFSSHDDYYNDESNYSAGDDSDSGGESDIVILGMIVAGFVVVEKKYAWRVV